MNDLDRALRDYVQPWLHPGEHVLGVAFGFREPPLLVRLVFFWLPIVRVLGTHHFFAVATTHRFVMLRARAGLFAGRPERWIGNARAVIDYAHLARVEAKTFMAVKSLVFTLRDGRRERIDLKPTVAGLPGQVEMYRQYADWLRGEIPRAAQRAVALGMPLGVPVAARGPAKPSEVEVLAGRAFAWAKSQPLLVPLLVVAFGASIVLFGGSKLARALDDFESATGHRRNAKSPVYDANEKRRQVAMADESEADAWRELGVAAVAGTIGVVVMGAGVAFGAHRRRAARRAVAQQAWQPAPGAARGQPAQWQDAGRRAA